MWKNSKCSRHLQRRFVDGRTDRAYLGGRRCVGRVHSVVCNASVASAVTRGAGHMLSEKSQRTQNGTMFVVLDWPLNASRRLSASAELLVLHGIVSCMDGLDHRLVVICFVVHCDMPVLWRTCCSVDLYIRNERNAFFSRVRKCFTDDQLQTAGLLQECVIVSDGLAYLPDCFTAGDMSDIVLYLCTCWLSFFEATESVLMSCCFRLRVFLCFVRLCTQ